MMLRVELYGRLREAGLGESAELELGASPRAREVLKALSRLMGDKGYLLEGAVLASENEVLGPSAPVPRGRLAALPPVCGG